MSAEHEFFHGHPADAVRRLRAAGAEDPAADPAARWLLGAALGALGRYGEAAALLTALAAGPVGARHASLGASTLASHRRQLGQHADALRWDSLALNLALADDPAPADDPARPHRPQEAHIQLEGRLELVRLQRGQQGRADGVEQHRGQERPEHVAGRVGEGLGGRERHLDRARLYVGVDELEAQRGRGRRDRRPPLDAVPEGPGSSLHRSSFAWWRPG